MVELDNGMNVSRLAFSLEYIFCVWRSCDAIPFVSCWDLAGFGRGHPSQLSIG